MKRLTPGAKALRAYLLATSRGISIYDRPVCRPNTARPDQPSMHGAGRALDIMVPKIRGRADTAVGDPIANWLLRNAADLGVQLIIWNRMVWSRGRSASRFRAYPARPHDDHIHVELNYQGAAGRTPWFQHAEARGPDLGQYAAGIVSHASAAAAAAMRRPTLRRGARGEAVTELQSRLSRLGLPVGPIDGAFGPKTEAAVRALQSSRGITVDGVVGPDTWSILVAPPNSASTPVGGGAPETTAPAPSWSRVDRVGRMRHVMNLLVRRYDLAPNASAGIVGNLVAESGVLPNRIEGSTEGEPMRGTDFYGKKRDFSPEEVMRRNPLQKIGPALGGFGLAQWTFHTRRDGLFRHVYDGRVLGASIVNDMDAQVDYLVSEMKRDFAPVWRALKAPGVSLHAASDIVARQFERPANIINHPPGSAAHQTQIQERRRFSEAALRASKG